MKLSIAILCGGGSKRFGKDKSIHKYHGKPLYRHIYDELNPLSDDIFIQCGKKDTEIYEIDSNNDDYLDLGPIGGIYSAIKHSKHPRTFVIACDMPNISRNFVNILAKRKGDIIVPVWENGYYEPLCAIYSKKTLSTFEYKIISGELKISSLFSEFKIEKIKIEPLIEKGVIKDIMFKNINYPSDIGSCRT